MQVTTCFHFQDWKLQLPGLNVKCTNPYGQKGIWTGSKMDRVSVCVCVCVCVLFLKTGWLKKSRSLLSNSPEKGGGNNDRHLVSHIQKANQSPSPCPSHSHQQKMKMNQQTRVLVPPRPAQSGLRECLVERDPLAGPGGRSSASPRSSRAPHSLLWHSVPIENSKKSNPPPAHLTGCNTEGDPQGTHQASEQHFWWFILTLCLMPSYSSKL